jgi:hypothetical protein
MDTSESALGRLGHELRRRHLKCSRELTHCVEACSAASLQPGNRAQAHTGSFGQFALKYGAVDAPVLQCGESDNRRTRRH